MFLVLTCVIATSLAAFAEAVPRMTVDELKSRFGTEDILILDARSGRDWNGADVKITGAVRVNPSEVNQWSTDFPKDRTVVLYCA